MVRRGAVMGAVVRRNDGLGAGRPETASARTSATVRAVLPLLLALAGCAEAPPSTVPPRAVRVAPVKVSQGAALARYAGALGPRQQVDLAFRTPGRVATVKRVGAGPAARQAHEGDHVSAGEVLASLDLDDLGRQAAAAEASATAARAQLDAARLALAQAEREATRARALSKSGAVPPAEQDRAEAALGAAKAQRDAAESTLRARVEQHQLTRNALGDAALRSPIDGVLTRLGVDPGEAVAPNVPVVTVMDTRELVLTFGLPDSRLATVQLGQHLPVTVDALPGRARDGVVTRLAPTPDPVLRTYAVDVTVSDVEDLRAGMTATTRLPRADAEALTVPLASLVRAGDGAQLAVFVLGDDGRTVRRRGVEVLDLLENDALLKGGVRVGERVVTEGAALVRDADVVGVVP